MKNRLDLRRWTEVRATFETLIELEELERRARLDLLSTSDPELRAAVDALLAADAEADARLASLEAGADPLGLAGRTVSHFQIREPIGAGGMGVVYAAEDSRLGRPVALKFLLPPYSLDGDTHARFLREAHSAAALDHPNLCTVYEVGATDDGRLFLAMALYPGETLKARLARNGPLPLEECLDIARQVGEGLKAAHAAGIVHRDLKPGNIMLLPDGTVKILDFGLAKVRDQSLSEPGTRFGTVSYMAPEQIRGESVDGRTDLWALGVVLYEMLTGAKPFRGGEEIAIARAILDDEPVLLSRCRSDVPAGVEEVILKLLRQDPARRFASATDVLRHIVGAETDPHGVIPVLRTRWRRANAIVSRGQRRVVALGALLAAGILGYTVLTPRVGGEPQLAKATTRNAEAYRLYVEARSYERRARISYQRQNFRIAQLYLEQALQLDPDFALAHAELAEVLGMQYLGRLDPSPAMAQRQMQEAQAAVRLAPDVPDAHIALARALYTQRDWTRALAEFRIAAKGLPNDATLWMKIASVHRRLGNWDDALAAFERATRIDPHNAGAFEDAGGHTLLYRHRYADAVRAFDEALRLAPDYYEATFLRGLAFVHWEGQLDTMRAVLRRLPPDVYLGMFGTRAAQRAQLFFWERETDSLLQVLSTSGTEVFEGTSFYVPQSLYAAWAHQLRGDRRAAHAAFNSSRIFIDSVIRELPDDPRLHAARGYAMAGLGRFDEALGEARWLKESRAYRDDAFEGMELAEDRARILAQVGDAPAALDEIERLLATPSGLSVHTLRLDPRWDPIRENPRFQRLLEGKRF